MLDITVKAYLLLSVGVHPLSNKLNMDKKEYCAMNC